jgi:GPH family glycoside/pentoside/hexuronide:cation symporter
MAAWLGVTSILFYTCYTVFSVPYKCLTYEMSANYDERTSIMGYTSIWAEIGEISYQWIVPLASLSFFASKMIGIQSISWFVAIFCMMLLGSLPALFGKERFYKLQENKKDRIPMFQSAKEALKNKAFAILILLTLLQIVSGLLASSMDYYLLVYYMFDGDIVQGSFWKAILSSGYGLMGFIGVPFVLWWSKRSSKANVLRGVYLLLIVKAVLSWFIYRPGNHYLILIDPIFGALFWTAVTTVKESMMADICDEDELQYGQRREGMFSSVFGWITKSAIALSAVAHGIALSLSGFDEELGGNQSDETFLAMRLTLMLGPFIPTLIALFVLSKFPITRQKALQTRNQLEEVRGII